tara:strand:+ start:17 stop:6946 length:6930 start_codon:yes stop_codon:yes gene_type:complete
MIWLPVNVWSNPSGGSIILGDAQIHDPSGNTLSIEQFSDRAVIEWENFSIDSGQLTQFFQPGASSAVLNRVVGGSPSAINGALRGNGNVWLINQNGVVIGPTGTVDVFGFLASSLDVSNEAFMAGGDMNFNGGIGDTVNFGTINAAGGDVFLVGRTVANHGVIGAVDGTVGLAAGNNVLFKSNGSERLFVSAGEGSVTNTGEIVSAMAELKAHGNVGALAVNNTGAIRAGGVNNEGGRVVLSAVQGNVSTTGEISVANSGAIEITSGMGEIQIGGILNANSSRDRGGSVNISGQSVNLLADANVSASGPEGGTVQIGGNAESGRIEVQAGAIVRADGNTGIGGMVDLRAGDIVIYGNSTLGADGETEGGVLSLTGSGLVSVDGVASANGRVGNGGRIAISGENVMIGQTGNVVADGGNNGGLINVSAVDTATIAGQVNSNGETGDGGSILVVGTDVEVGVVGSVNANGASGGTINLQAADGLSILGSVSAVGSENSGGTINATGDEVEVGPQALVDASGVSGGDINIGGGFQGNGALRNSSKTTVAAGALVRANGSDGDGGNVVIWSDGETQFHGRIEAEGAGIGNGGFVEVSGADQLTFRGNVSTLSQNGAVGTLLLDPTDVTIVDGAATNSSGATLTDDDVNAALAANNLIIHTAGAGTDIGNILVDNDVRIEWGAPNSNSMIGGARYAENFHSFTLLATGNITVEGHIISNGMGNVNLFAGWNGTTGIPSTPTDPAGIANTDNEGIGGNIGLSQLLSFGTPSSELTRGTVRLNTSVNDQAVQVGSRFGETNVVARDLILEVPLGGSHRFAHLGYRPTTNVESGGAGVYGLINSSTHREGANGAATGSIDLTATDLGAAVLASDSTGDINVELQGSLHMLGEQGNGDSYKYTQIGHGGNGVNDAGGNGIGFDLINADSSGDITVNAGLGSAPSAILLQAGREGGYSRIGNGGMANPDNADDARGAGAFMGDISVVNHGTGDIVAQGNEGNGWAGFAQIGNGGYRNGRTYDQTEGVDTNNANVRDSALNFDTTLGPRAFDPDLLTPDGNPVGDRGDITVDATNGNVIFEAGTSSRSAAIVGHGGHERAGNIGMFDANGNVIEKANISVKGNSVLFLNKEDADDQRIVRIGHGGYQSPGNIAGDIEVEARLSDVRFEAGAREGYAQIGHGGVIATWNTNQQGVQGTLQGDIDVKAANNIHFRSGGSPNPNDDARAYSQIGHGGFGWVALSEGPNRLLNNGHHGDITVNAGGSIDFMSGRPDEFIPDNSQHAMIGHGGNNTRGDHYGKITVNAGTGIRFEAVAGWDSAKQDAGADTILGTDDDVYSLGDATGDGNFVMIGHGGKNPDFENNQSNNGGRQEEQLGGIAGSSRDSSIIVTTTTGDIEFIAPQSSNSNLAMVQNVTGGRFNDEADDLFTLRAVKSHAAIGHTLTDGAAFNVGGIGGDITVTANDGAILFVGSDIQQGYSNHTSQPTPDAFSSRRSEQNFTQIGHGGVVVRGNKVGSITVSAKNDISFKAGMGRHGQAMIGHGGYDADSGGGNGNLAGVQGVMAEGDISVISTMGSVYVHGGNGDAAIEIADYSWGQIGHGGRSSAGSILNSDITVRAGGGDVEVHAGHGYRELWAIIGHGGRDSRAEFWDGDINVYAQNNISIRGTESAYNQGNNFGQIGHGGFDTDIQGDNNDAYNNGTTVTGQIDVVAATGDIILLAGVDNTSAASGGAGNFQYEGDLLTETVTDSTAGTTSQGYIYGGGDLTSDANRRAQGGHAAIGHGGQHNNLTVIDQNLNVTAGNDLIVAAGEFRDARAGIGHGGDIDAWGGNRSRRRTVLSGDIDVTVGDDMLVYAGSGDNASVKIGHGDYRTINERNAVETGIDGRGRETRWEGNIAVKVGDDLILDADESNVSIGLDDGRNFSNGSSSFTAYGTQDTFDPGDLDFNRVMIGHRDSTDNRANHNGVVSRVGNTYIAVSRDNPTIAGTGSITTRVSPGNANGVAISSASNGLFGELRVYAPTRASAMNIATGTLFNAGSYQGTATSGNKRADEYEATEFTFNLHDPDTTDPPVGSFTPENDPAKSYALINSFGRYGLYLANPNDLYIPGGGLTPINAGRGGGGDPLPFIRRARIISQPIVITIPTKKAAVIPPTPTVSVGFDGTPIIFVGGTVEELQSSISNTLDTRGVERFDGNDVVDDQIGDALAELFEQNAGDDQSGADYSSIPVGSTGSGFTSAAISGSDNVMTPLTVALQTRVENGRVMISLALVETFGAGDALQQTTSRAQSSAPPSVPTPAPAPPESEPFGAGGGMEEGGADGFDSFFQ